jgi:SAM-dependent methyltransferase
VASDEWTRYYDAVGLEPRTTLLEALRRFDEEELRERLAVDLGCGRGGDAVELLGRGWRVLAMDGTAEAIARLRALELADDERSRLETRVARFETAEWPSVDLVNASFALPFCPPGDFPAVWERIEHSLQPGGRFSGHLFGDRDEWADQDDMTFQTRAEAEALLSRFEVELFDEIEEDSTTAVGKPKHWHFFQVVARRR